jgi:2-polyprenyl-3-methyl-5-hydroxy-6-metoxy-1,4-benzoquinol methylase
MDFEFVEILKCPLCDSDKSTVRFVRDQFKALKCENCGMVYLDKHIKNLSNFYADDRLLSYSLYYSLSHTSDSESFKKRILLLERYLANKGKLLDVGCNIGTFLTVAAESCGWKDIMGIEPNTAATEYCRQFDIPVINDFFNEEVAFQLKNKFDAIYLGDVIEHVPDPDKIVRNLFTVLNKNGVVLVITPNFESIIARIFQIKPLEHILYFTEDTIKYLFEKEGFEIVLLQRTTRNRSFRALMFGTSITSNGGKFILRMLIRLHLENFANFFIRLFFRDEIELIARKKG